MNYEELQIQNDTLHIHEMNLSEVDGLKGFYLDGSIAIEKDLTSTEKACILAEELGHHYTTVGDILDQSIAENRKQEHRARVWAYRNALGLSDIIEAYKHGCRNRYELAEHLNVTETFLLGAIEDYKAQYGLFTRVDNYMVYFEPLGVLELNI